MRVDPQRQLRVRVAELVCHPANRATRSERQGGERVPRVVQAHPANARGLGAATNALPGPLHVAFVPRGARFGAEQPFRDLPPAVCDLLASALPEQVNVQIPRNLEVDRGSRVASSVPSVYRDRVARKAVRKAPTIRRSHKAGQKLSVLSLSQIRAMIQARQHAFERGDRGIVKAELDAVLEMLRNGVRFSTACKAIRRLPQSVREAVKHREAFQDILIAAEHEALAVAEAALHHAATHPDRNGRYNTPALTFYLTNRDSKRWKNRIQQQVEVEDVRITEVRAKLTTEQLQALRDVAMKQVLDVTPKHVEDEKTADG